MADRRYLPDVNVLIALSDPEHAGHRAAVEWYRQIEDDCFLLCSVTEAGFVRLTAAPQVGGREMKEAMAMLRAITRLPNSAQLPMPGSWLKLVEPFASRLHGYRQVTDALLLGLVIESGAILVTLDQRVEALASGEFQGNLLTLR
ncbi:MAG: TA system VapC family ribonuclease toxin [Terracidiphilus sp.]